MTSAPDLLQTRQRLGQLLYQEELLFVVPAVLCSVVGSAVGEEERQSRSKVWLGLGRTKARPDFIVFVFTRTGFFPGFQLWLNWAEHLYCVIPVVSNIRLDVSGSRCVLSWKQVRPSLARQLPSPGDLLLEEVHDSVGLLQELRDQYLEAGRRGLIFHEEQRSNHREVWAYRDYIPTGLAKLSAARVEIHTPHTGRTTRREATRFFDNSVLDESSLRLLCLTWNVGAKLPDKLESLEAVLDEEPSPDLCCLGFQETCELSARRLLADGEEWTKWREWAECSVKDAYEGELELLELSRMVGMLVLVFVRSTLRDFISQVRSTTLGIGVGGYGGNKGAVAVRLLLGRTSFCFINAHLAAGQQNYIARCQNYSTIMRNLRFNEHGGESKVEELPNHSSIQRSASEKREESSAQASTASFDVRPSTFADVVERRERSHSTYALNGAPRFAYLDSIGILDHDHVIWLGDTNSRLHWPGHVGGMPLQQARQKVKERLYGELLGLDQLNMMRRDSMAFNDFEEQKIAFLPSYKWFPQRDAFDMRSQKHVPAWTDRILYRSKTSPSMTVNQYSVYLGGLRQSDHRLVFACIRAPVDDAMAAHTSQRANETNQASTLQLHPDEVVFKAAKPDVPQKCNVRLVLSCKTGKQQRKRFGVFLETVSGDLSPVLSSLEDKAAPRSEQELYDLPLLARWLHISPSKGVLRVSRPTDLCFSLCVTNSVMERHERRLKLVVKIGDGSNTQEFPFFLRAELEPSVMRAPLQALEDLGHRPLLSKEEANGGVEGAATRHPRLPPKEALSVMQWVLMQSRDMPPNSLEWWPDLLVENLGKTSKELRELQRYIEHGWPLPKDSPQFPVRTASLFLLNWLSVLPEPVLPASALQELEAQGEGIDTREHKAPARRRRMLRRMQELPRVVLLTTLAFFNELERRHGGSRLGDVPSRLAGCLTQQVPASEVAGKLVAALSEDLKLDRCFPPLRFISQCSKPSR